MKMIYACALAALLTACAATPAVQTAPPSPPTLTPPYARDRCGEDITPTHAATPVGIACP